jgi:hypothetical protein
VFLLQIPFPKSYPKSALLGCVDLVDCWDQSAFGQHRERCARRDIPVEESSSPFLFVCHRPRQLKLGVGLSGQHKV